MNAKTLIPLESLLVARDFENMMRLLANLPRLELFVLVGDETACSVKSKDNGHIAKILTKGGKVNIIVSMTK